MLPRRRSLALASGVLLLGGPALAACGFDYPTNQVNTIANGATDRDKTVYVLNAVVVASRPDTGTVIATLSNSSSREPVRLGGLSATNDGPLLSTEDIDIGLLPGAAANLGSDPQLRIAGAFGQGTFGAGDFVSLTFNFDNGESVTVEAPVVADCGQYDGLDLAPPLETGENPVPLPEYECGPPTAGDGVDADEPVPEGGSEE